MKDVYAFAGQVEDVNANLGIMISTSGFDAGAIAVAKEKNIILRSYRVPNEQDWKDLLKNSWVFITAHNVEIKEVFVTISKVKYELSKEALLFDNSGNSLGTVNENLIQVWKSPENPKHLGIIDLEIFPETFPLYIQDLETQRFIEISHLVSKIVVSATKYPINLTLSKGNIIEDYESGKPVYQQLFSEGINWQDLIKNQKGKDITQEEYQADLKNNNLIADVTQSAKWIRLVVSKKAQI